MSLSCKHQYGLRAENGPNRRSQLCEDPDFAYWTVTGLFERCAGSRTGYRCALPERQIGLMSEGSTYT
jgi:hypothetical protein